MAVIVAAAQVRESRQPSHRRSRVAGIATTTRFRLGIGPGDRIRGVAGIASAAHSGENINQTVKRAEWPAPLQDLTVIGWVQPADRRRHVANVA